MRSWFVVFCSGRCWLVFPAAFCFFFFFIAPLLYLTLAFALTFVGRIFHS